MKISGFTFVKNATKLFIPAKEAILSVLPICDEFVVALGDNAPDDRTLEEIMSIGSDKIKIIHTVWDIPKYPKNTVFAQQTDIAKEACTGDWLLYIQCDEAIHEQYLPTIQQACQKYLNDKEVEGFVFDYKHFWGDFQHYHRSHCWYPKEIRLIRNLPQIHSWKDAQSFRYFPGTFGYTYEEYQNREGNRKLNVAHIKAEIFHYGFVRPPEMMNIKRKSSEKSYQGKQVAEKELIEVLPFDYGPMDRIPVFKGTHPKAMQEWIKKFDWQDRLQKSGPINPNRPKHKHEKTKYRLLSFVEQRLLGGRLIGGFKNYNIIR